MKTFQEWWDEWGGSVAEYEAARSAWFAAAESYNRVLPTDWVESEEFDGVCYSYRSWPISDPAGVAARFAELKAYIKDRVA